MFALVDCNNFYASCERLFRPDLQHKPIVVLSNNDGCVIARSNEAKAIGVPMGAPAFQYQELFLQHQVQVFSANFALYGDLSTRVMQILTSFCPEIEIYSIDEAFLDLHTFKHFDLKTYGLEINRTVRKNTGIPISIGIAPTKSLAKVANKIAKKFPTETNSVHVLDSPEKIQKALKWLPVEDIWGIGRQHAKKLKHMNIHTALDFANMNNEWVLKNLSVVELRLKKELNGIPVLNLEDKKTKQSIATTRTFEKNYTQYEEVKERIVTFALTCAEKLRQQKSCCNSILLFIQTNVHRKDLDQYSNSIRIKLPFATNSSIELAKFATQGLAEIYKEGYAYKRAGITVMDLCPEINTQLTLFEKSNPQHKKVMEVMDKINTSIGHHKIKLAAQDKGRVWKMRQEKLSPRFTTKLDEIITIQAH
jgi:DNA polymerase V